MKHRPKRSTGRETAAVSDDLIRQVSESVVVRSRRGRRNQQPDPAPVLVSPALVPPPAPIEVPAAAPAAESIPAVEAAEPPVAKVFEAPVLVEKITKPEAPRTEVSSAAKNVSTPDEAAVAEPPAQNFTPASPNSASGAQKSVLAMFCYLEPDCVIGQFITHTAPMLAARGVSVHLFSRLAFPLNAPGVKVHVLGDSENADLLASVDSFTARALNAFQAEFSGADASLTLLGFEWSSVGALLELSKSQKLPVIVSLHSLECQRSDLSSPLSRRIQELEVEGMKCARTILIHETAAADAAAKRLPECKGRLVSAVQRFRVEDFSSGLDAGAVKARFNVGPIDPTVLFVGNFDERHGPDVLMKAVPPVLKNHPQTRFIFVGDGPEQWPMRVHARYLLLEYAVRFAGHLSGKPLAELIEASDVVCVPSRERTEDWPILAAWAARRPVMTTHPMAEGGWLKHEENSVLTYAQENSCVWGLERLLFDPNLCKKIVANGYEKVLSGHGWGRAAQQLEELISINAAH